MARPGPSCEESSSTGNIGPTWDAQYPHARANGGLGVGLERGDSLRLGQGLTKTSVSRSLVGYQLQYCSPTFFWQLTASGFAISNLTYNPNFHGRPSKDYEPFHINIYRQVSIYRQIYF